MDHHHPHSPSIPHLGGGSRLEGAGSPREHLSRRPLSSSNQHHDPSASMMPQRRGSAPLQPHQHSSSSSLGQQHRQREDSMLFLPMQEAPPPLAAPEQHHDAEREAKRVQAMEEYAATQAEEGLGSSGDRRDNLSLQNVNDTISCRPPPRRILEELRGSVVVGAQQHLPEDFTTTQERQRRRTKAMQECQPYQPKHVEAQLMQAGASHRIVSGQHVSHLHEQLLDSRHASPLAQSRTPKRRTPTASVPQQEGTERDASRTQQSINNTAPTAPRSGGGFFANLGSVGSSFVSPTTPTPGLDNQGRRSASRGRGEEYPSRPLDANHHGQRAAPQSPAVSLARTSEQHQQHQFHQRQLRQGSPYIPEIRTPNSQVQSATFTPAPVTVDRVSVSSHSQRHSPFRQHLYTGTQIRSEHSPSIRGVIHSDALSETTTSAMQADKRRRFAKKGTPIPPTDLPWFSESQALATGLVRMVPDEDTGLLPGEEAPQYSLHSEEIAPVHGSPPVQRFQEIPAQSHVQELVVVAPAPREDSAPRRVVPKAEYLPARQESPSRMVPPQLPPSAALRSTQEASFFHAHQRGNSEPRRTPPPPGPAVQTPPFGTQQPSSPAQSPLPPLAPAQQQQQQQQQQSFETSTSAPPISTPEWQPVDANRSVPSVRTPERSQYAAARDEEATKPVATTVPVVTRHSPPRRSHNASSPPRSEVDGSKMAPPLGLPSCPAANPEGGVVPSRQPIATPSVSSEQPRAQATPSRVLSTPPHQGEAMPQKETRAPNHDEDEVYLAAAKKQNEEQEALDPRSSPVVLMPMTRPPRAPQTLSEERALSTHTNVTSYPSLFPPSALHRTIRTPLLPEAEAEAGAAVLEGDQREATELQERQRRDELEAALGPVLDEQDTLRQKVTSLELELRQQLWSLEAQFRQFLCSSNADSHRSSDSQPNAVSEDLAVTDETARGVRNIQAAERQSQAKDEVARRRAERNGSSSPREAAT